MMEMLDERKRIGLKIREIRTNKGISLVELADQVGKSKVQISRIELGKNSLRRF